MPFINVFWSLKKKMMLIAFKEKVSRFLGVFSRGHGSGTIKKSTKVSPHISQNIVKRTPNTTEIMAKNLIETMEEIEDAQEKLLLKKAFLIHQDIGEVRNLLKDGARLSPLARVTVLALEKKLWQFVLELGDLL